MLLPILDKTNENESDPLAELVNRAAKDTFIEGRARNDYITPNERSLRKAPCKIETMRPEPQRR